MSILLNNFKTGAFNYIVCKLRINAHFSVFLVYLGIACNKLSRVLTPIQFSTLINNVFFNKIF